MLQVPDAYLRAIFGSFLASRFIYSMGISASPVSFFAFMVRERRIQPNQCRGLDLNSVLAYQRQDEQYRF